MDGVSDFLPRKRDHQDVYDQMIEPILKRINSNCKRVSMPHIILVQVNSDSGVVVGEVPRWSDPRIQGMAQTVTGQAGGSMTVTVNVNTKIADLENFYDGELTEDMQAVINICEEHDIPMVACFQYGNNKVCSSCYVPAHANQHMAMSASLAVSTLKQHGLGKAG